MSDSETEALRKTIERLQFQQEIAADERLQLLAQLNRAQESLPAAVKQPKVNLPAPFSRNRKDCRTFQ
jgi:predicted amidophosphoribosyltransferase